MTLEMMVWGLTMERVFSRVSCAFKHFLLCLSCRLPLLYLPSDGPDEVDEVPFPCFPQHKWKESAPMHVK